MDVYCQVLGQHINVSKAGLFFNHVVLPKFKNLIKDKLGYQKMQIGDLYLCIPTLYNASKKQTMSYLLDKVKKKMQGWKEKTLSFVEKEG